MEVVGHDAFKFERTLQTNINLNKTCKIVEQKFESLFLVNFCFVQCHGTEVVVYDICNIVLPGC